MKRFTDYLGAVVLLSSETEQHITDAHPEVHVDQIRQSLGNPDEVRRSSYKGTTSLYYRLRSSNRYICVVVKNCVDGLYISTAMTTTKPKTGEVLYVKDS
jgi:hypothetical protein